MANYFGSALLGLSQGARDYEQEQNDLSFQKSQRAALLQAAKDKSDEVQTDTQSKKIGLRNAELEANLFSNSAPVTAPPQQVQQPNPQFAPVQATGQVAQPQQQSNTPQDPGTQLPAVPTVDNFKIDPAVQTQRDQVRLSILQQELAKEPDPNNRALLQKEITRVVNTLPQQSAQQEGAPVTNPLAEKVNTFRANGGTPPVSVLSTVVDTFKQQGDQYMAMANQARATPNGGAVAMKFQLQAANSYKQAATEQAHITSEQKTQLELKKNQNEEIGQTLGNLDPKNLTQEQYSQALSTLQDNPQFLKLAGQLGITGDLGQDGNKINSLVARGVPLQKKIENDIKLQQLDLAKQNAEYTNAQKQSQVMANEAKAAEKQQKVEEAQNAIAATKQNMAEARQQYPNIPVDTTADGLPVKIQQQRYAANQNIVKDVQKQNNYANELLQNLKVLDDLNNRGITGAVEGRAFALTSADLANFRSAQNNIATLYTKANFTRTTNFDEKISQSIVPSTVNPGKANIEIIDRMIAFAKEAKNKADFENKYFTANPYGNPAKANTSWQKYEEENPLFTTIKGKNGSYRAYNTNPTSYEDWAESKKATK